MKKISKVLVLNPYLSTLGGGEKHMGYFCQCLEEYYNYNIHIDILVHSYNEVDVFAEDYVTVEDLNKQFGLNLMKTSIRKIKLDRPLNKIQYLKNKKTIENITKEYDLFVNNMFLSKHIGKAKVNIYQCMFPPKRFINEMNDKFFNKVVAKIYDYRFFHSYDSMISNSKFTKFWLEKYWESDKKNCVIYPPVFEKNELENRYIESEKKNIIISVGRFFVGSHSKKQLELVRFFVNNIELFKDYEYHLVGAISKAHEDIKYLDEIKKIASQVENIFIHENCKYDDLMDLYRKAKIFWHATGYNIDENAEPEKMEHFGITTVEAMSYGAVPVVINKGGQKETVILQKEGFLWNNESECIEKTKFLIDNDDLRKEMAFRCTESAQKYSIDLFYEKTREVFHELQI